MIVFFQLSRTVTAAYHIQTSHLRPYYVSFGRYTKSPCSLLFSVYAGESKRSHTGGKCVTCSGLTNPREGRAVWSLGCLEETT